MKDYKDTLYMGKTDFEMRGNLNNKEPLIQQKWKDMDLYNERIKLNEGKREYTLHDGPPYANGDIHLGHALNKILKDFVVRYKNMNGFKSVFIPGWDTHGLPIENALQKAGVSRKDKTTAEFRNLCTEYAYKQVERQRKGFERLGVLGDFENPYITLQHDFERDQILVFAKMAERGLIYKGLKPVYWSPSSESALAEAEIEYKDKEDSSIYFSLPVKDGKGDFEGASFLVWTTTPWTLPANLAVCAGPQIEYVVAQTEKGKFIFGRELLEKLTELLELGDVEILSYYKGTDLEGLQYTHPLYNRVSPCILGDYVSTSDGSGLVHIAPGHGEDDFMVGKQYNLDILCPVDSKGYMMKEAGKYEGMFYAECNEEVIKDMEACGCLLKCVKINHSYPHDWRTKKPVIFRATPQWFASIDPIKDDILKAINNVTWNPKWGDVRISNMIRDRHDWCISRQRAWGVPIPVFYAENDEEILDQNVLKHVAELFGQYGSNVWFEREAKDLLPEGFTHPGSPNGKFRKETDIMDVWFDSGSSYMLLQRRGLQYPADLYLEGSDQYRGWFNSSIITGVATTGVAPYKTVVSHGFTLDGEGRKMSKSLGNTVDPIKVCNESGADILRLWVASVEYRADMPLSKDILKQVSESYRKIRNTLRFLLSNTSDFNPKDSLPYEKLELVDKYMYIKLQKFIKQIKDNYDNFDFGEVYRNVNSYIANTLSAFYLDFTKDILYIEDPKSNKRLSTQTVFYQVLLALIKLLTPILPHTMSEAYDSLQYKEAKDVYLTDMPIVDEKLDSRLEASFDEFMDYRDVVLKALEEARANKVIGKSFNAKLTITLDEKSKKIFDLIKVDASQLLIVSQLEFADGNSFDVKVEPATGDTCARCWMIVPSINEEELCPRCNSIVFKIR
ncbi:MAG: isoleucine--tRNA ligase [Erysipelotrichaceae bacterium]|nr:isoleucine--tRNA ligase [Erysipelotrichaceae bacterium]